MKHQHKPFVPFEASFNEAEAEEFDELESILTPEIAVRYLEKTRWNGKVTCCGCGSDKIQKNGFYQHDNVSINYVCSACGKKFRYMTDTIFSNNTINIEQQLLVLLLLSKKFAVPRVSNILNILESSVNNTDKKLKVALTEEAQAPFIKKVINGISTGELLDFARSYNALTSLQPKTKKAEKDMAVLKRKVTKTKVPATKQVAPKEQEQLLTTEEVVRMLGVAKSTLVYWNRNKPAYLPYKIVDKKRVFKLADVEKVKQARVLESQSIQPKTEAVKVPLGLRTISPPRPSLRGTGKMPSVKPRIADFKAAIEADLIQARATLDEKRRKFVANYQKYIDADLTTTQAEAEKFITLKDLEKKVEKRKNAEILKSTVAETKERLMSEIPLPLNISAAPSEETPKVATSTPPDKSFSLVWAFIGFAVVMALLGKGFQYEGRITKLETKIEALQEIMK